MHDDERVSRKTVAFLVVIAGLVLAWWAAGTGAPEPAAGPIAGSEALAVRELNAPPATAAPASPSQPEAPAASARADEPAPTPAAPKDNAQDEPHPLLPQRSGPIAELKALYGSEPRASASAQIESAIEAQFRRPEVPPGLLKSVVCRTTVCRIETRWTPERAEGFMSALMHMATEPAGEQAHFDNQIAIAPEEPDAVSGIRVVDVYARFSSGAQPQPSAP